MTNLILMDSKRSFYNTIYDHYFEVVGNNLSLELLANMCDRITDYYYNQYTRFRSQYPKSVKRYSTFQIKDLNHPQTFELIIRFFKEKNGSNYFVNVIMVLGSTLVELQDFEKNRKDFYNIF